MRRRTAVVNHGSEPISEASLCLAEVAVDRFAQQAAQVHGMRLRGRRRLSEADRHGRFGFVLVFACAGGQEIEHEIAMPGVRLDLVEYRAQDRTSAWDIHRLYLNGASWLWEFAINLCGGPVQRG